MPEASTSIGIRKRLYLALVRSQLSYCSQLWRPRLMKDIVCLEKVQRRASKYILGDRESDYRSRLITLNLLPLMYWLELQDLIFCVKSLQSPSDNFNIRNYVQFSTSSTRSSGCKLLYKTSCSSTTRHFYLNRIVLGLDRHCPDHRDKNRKPQRQEELEQETTPTYNPAAPYHLVLIPLSMILLLFACSLK